MTDEQRPEVVEFGATERLSRRVLLVRALGSARHKRLVAPVAAALGALALFGSLVSDWQVLTVTEIDGAGIAPEATLPRVASGLHDLAGWTAGYLVGVLALVGCVGLVLFGAPAIRAHARVLGLTTAGVLTGLLIAIASYLGESSPVLQQAGPFGFDPDDLRYDLTYERGMTFAFLGIGALAAALYLAGSLTPAARTASSAPHATAAPADGAAADGAVGEAAEEEDWPWRRPGAKRTEEPESALPEPIDLTVTPTAPFVPLGDGSQPDGPKPGGKE
ncbi:hypothetical protein WEI85_03815 [Actinomycetes bacterium KLBMP 9797]